MIQTYNTQQAYISWTQGDIVYVAHPDGGESLVQGDDILDADGHLFLIYSDNGGMNHDT